MGGEPEREFSDGLAARLEAATYGPSLWLGEKLGMRRRRRELLARARGRTLEIGAGTGLNAGLYPPAIEQLVLAEPDPAMARKLRQSVATSGRDALVFEALAESLPFGDGGFDTVVSTMVLCTVVDPVAAIAEVARVLRPNGSFLFCEHVLSDSPRLARWQRRLAGPWASVASGCRCDQETLAMIRERLDVGPVDSARWRGMPPLVRPLVVGEATRTV